MTKRQREECKQLVAEAKAKTENESGDFVHKVRSPRTAMDSENQKDELNKDNYKETNKSTGDTIIDKNKPGNIENYNNCIPFPNDVNVTVHKHIRLI